MWPTRGRSGASLVLTAALLAGCASEIEPAQRAISDIEATVSAAAPEAQIYVPAQLADVRTKLGELKAAFERREYSAILARAPTVMSAAQLLAGEAAAKKAEVTKALDVQWSQLATGITQNLTIIQNRIDLQSANASRLSTQKPRKTAKGRASGKPESDSDLDAARVRLSNAASLWSKSQAAYATGNLAEAVSTATALTASLEDLVHELPVD